MPVFQEWILYFHLLYLTRSLERLRVPFLYESRLNSGHEITRNELTGLDLELIIVGSASQPFTGTNFSLQLHAPVQLAQSQHKVNLVFISSFSRNIFGTPLLSEFPQILPDKFPEDICQASCRCHEASYGYHDEATPSNLIYLLFFGFQFHGR